ncbi:hypothetical protein HBB16_08695 [Pseudonocardia sp. MCCB 268]|nr:hypothetical protein [Pseudonocardia cytotoxica]
MLAQRIIGLFPELDRDEALQLAAIRSVVPARALGPVEHVLALPVAPHHSASAAAARRWQRRRLPGAVSWPTAGALLDECPHWPALSWTRSAPGLEEGEVRLARGRHRPLPGTVPAGPGGEPVLRARCRSTGTAPAGPDVRRRYMARVSAAADRVDLRVTMEPVIALTDTGSAVTINATVRRRVLAARAGRRGPLVAARLAPRCPHRARGRFPLPPDVWKPGWRNGCGRGAERPGADRALRVA